MHQQLGYNSNICKFNRKKGKTLPIQRLIIKSEQFCYYNIISIIININININIIIIL